MAIELFAHPFSSYCQKAIIALHEHGVDWTLRMIEPGSEWNTEWEAIWPIRRFPVLREGGRVVPEASAIIEHLHARHRTTTPLIPDDPDDAVEVRMLDRFFDHYVSDPQARIVVNALRREDQRDPLAGQEAQELLDRAYAWLDARMAGRTWAVGEAFSMADCAAAPSLFYADWTHPIGDRFANVSAYRARMLRRPSIARAVDAARPYRQLFPLPCPDGEWSERD